MCRAVYHSAAIILCVGGSVGSVLESCQSLSSQRVCSCYVG